MSEKKQLLRLKVVYSRLNDNIQVTVFQRYHSVTHIISMYLFFPIEGEITDANNIYKTCFCIIDFSHNVEEKKNQKTVIVFSRPNGNIQNGCSSIIILP